MDDLTPLIAELATFEHDAFGFVLFAFPWGEGELRGRTGPEPWQGDVLRRVSSVSLDDAVLEAVASGHGVGKSALVSWLILWSLSTATDTRGVVTANTETQLKTKTWAELAKWHRRFIGKELFKLEATSVFSTDPDRARTWRFDMIPWSERNSEAFAGLHNQGRRAVMLFDEASAIPDVIWESASGFLTDAETERLWLAFGNPTRSTGEFRRKFLDGSGWRTTQLDARSVSFTNHDLFKRWGDAYGEDSDFFRVRVRGVFPRTGELEFISQALVAAARVRDAATHRFDPLVLGVDVARYGEDESVIVIRKGRDARSMDAIRLRGVSTMELASRVIETAQALRADAVFIDGGGVGGGVVDRCRQLRLDVHDVQFGGRADRADVASQGERYANKRAEMWGAMRAWLQGGAIPDDRELEEQLVGTTYGFNGRDEIQLERKSDLKTRGLPSPDWADALALTFAYPVVPSAIAGADMPQGPLVKTEYDPFTTERVAA
jgi:hypothetical protein